jgi:hypothetical protein
VLRSDSFEAAVPAELSVGNGRKLGAMNALLKKIIASNPVIDF